jgi:hypothetical protein
MSDSVLLTWCSLNRKLPVVRGFIMAQTTWTFLTLSWSIILVVSDATPSEGQVVFVLYSTTRSLVSNFLHRSIFHKTPTWFFTHERTDLPQKIFVPINSKRSGRSRYTGVRSYASFLNTSLQFNLTITGQALARP